jgi:hypothetical protein
MYGSLEWTDIDMGGLPALINQKLTKRMGLFDALLRQCIVHTPLNPVLTISHRLSVANYHYVHCSVTPQGTDFRKVDGSRRFDWILEHKNTRPIKPPAIGSSASRIEFNLA